jgi:hypothetical protein
MLLRGVRSGSAWETIPLGRATFRLEVSYDRIPLTPSEKELRFLIRLPPKLKPKFLMFSGPLVGVNGLRPLSEPLRSLKLPPPRIAPRPGGVMMSMNRPPALWFSAANWSRVMWIALICDFAGSAAPSKLSTRMSASPPAISSSWPRISSGSSDSASICSRVSAEPNVSVFRSAAAACASRATVTSCSTFCSGRTMTCRLSPARTRTSPRRPGWNPGNSARTS